MTDMTAPPRPTPLPPGAEAPDFALKFKPRAAAVRLADFKGKKPVVLLFFPVAFSAVCTDEMCTVAESYARWEKLDAQVLGISVDSPYANAQFAEHCGASFPILSDFNREVIRSYGILNPDYHGLRDVAYRSAFVIDRAGKIAYSWASEDAAVMPPFEEIHAAVEAAA
jgi:glutaredoxin-dependent peroxiredoxin